MKLAELFKNWPSNTVATSQWISSIGISRQLLYKYVKSNLVVKLANGCYKKQGDDVDWTGALYAVQKQLNLPIYPCGYTALSLHGFRHHLTIQRKEKINLCGSKGTIVPKWLMYTDFKSEISYKTSTLFKTPTFNIEQDFKGSYSISVPAQEIAILEVLEDVNDSNSFEDALNIMENLVHIDQNRMQSVFSACTSYKVKRIFLFMAKYNHISFINDFHYKEEELGSGIMQIVENGKYDAEFKIMVPTHLKHRGENPF